MKHKRSLSQANQKSNIEQPTQAFEFDRVYEESATNEGIFQESVSPFLDYLLQGYNSTIFAYGASGSGKTFTMQGDRKSEGITQLICKKLFERIQEVQEHKQFKVKFSYVEIYNEQIRDLIQQGYSSNTKKQTQNLELREDPVKGTILANVTEVQIANCEQIQNLIDFGNKNRTVDATTLNSLSSRSHAVVQIHIQYKDINQGIYESTQFSTLTLVDLAGSEKSGVSSNQLETQKINQSLLVLGYCINQLSKGNKNNHVPYRNSKLTRMLKNSLGGNCKTLMIANISIANSSYEDTMNSLLYASHAKRIKNILIKNEVTSSQHIANYAQLVEGLQRQNNYLKKLVEETNQDQSLKQSSQVLNESVFTKEESQKLKFEIQKHFEQETECYKDISYISDRINLIEQENQQTMNQYQQYDPVISLNNLQSNESSCKQLLKDYNSNVKLVSLKQNKQISIQKLEKLSLNRINLLQKIKEYSGEQRIKLLKVFDQKAKSFQDMIDRHNQYQQKITNQDQEIDCLLKELSIKDSIIQSQNNLISVSNLECSQIKYTSSNLNNYQEYQAIQEESKPLIEFIAKQETKKEAQSILDQDKNIFLPTLIKYKQNNKVQNALAQIVQGKNRRSQSQCDPYNQPQRLSYTFAVQKQLPQVMKKSCNSALSGDTQQIADVILNECSKSKFQKAMSKISVDTTIPTETNDITKSTQNQNTSSNTICKINNFKNNSEIIQPKANKNDTQYLIKYSDIQQSFNSKKYNQLSPKADQGEFTSYRLQSNSKNVIKQPQKQLQNVLQSSKFKNQNPSNSKIKQPYFSKLLVDYSGYMYNDLGQLSCNDISLNNKKPSQNLIGSIDEIQSPTQRVKTDISVRNSSQNKLERFSSNQSIEMSNIQSKKIFSSREKDTNNNRNSSTYKRKHISSSKRQSANLQNRSYQF